LVLLFEIVFLTLGDEDLGEKERQRASNIFLSFSIYPLLTDLMLMANVNDLRNQILTDKVQSKHLQPTVCKKNVQITTDSQSNRSHSTPKDSKRRSSSNRLLKFIESESETSLVSVEDLPIN